KKCRFLVEAAHELGLSSRARVKNGRVEELAHRKEYRSHFLLATARAVGAVDVIAELCVPLLQKGGLLLAQKSKGQVDEELAHGRSLIGRLNARVERVVNLPAEALGKERLLVLIEKIGDTPPQYPRAWSAIKRGQKPR
ncbi:MAG TPA: RsmG family class I SAM-dependent methyltransferase, partial [Candidatus Obscuribacterales bacterium]